MKRKTESQKARESERKKRWWAKKRALAGKTYIPRDKRDAAALLLKTTSAEDTQYRAEQKAREQTPEYQESMKILANALLGKKER
jgi:hypothetical protein